MLVIDQQQLPSAAILLRPLHQKGSVVGENSNPYQCGLYIPKSNFKFTDDVKKLYCSMHGALCFIKSQTLADGISVRSFILRKR